MNLRQSVGELKALGEVGQAVELELLICRRCLAPSLAMRSSFTGTDWGCYLRVR